MAKITMVKKRLENGQACRKCEQAETMLKTRNLWHLIDNVVWADESDASAEGNLLAERHGVELAPFFIVEQDGTTSVYRSALLFAKELSKSQAVQAPSTVAAEDYQIPASGLVDAAPQQVVQHALTAFAERCAIAFSGAEDVVLIDMAAKSGLPYSVFCLDTGRLHPETYRFIDKVRIHYGIEISLVSPDPQPVEALVCKKGLFSFYDDGHQECCSVRKVGPLRRMLKQYAAWMTGQRRDQSPTRAELDVVAWDTFHGGKSGELCKFNPLADWSLRQTWDYIRTNAVPYNELHDQGYVSIGCEPCTRAIRPGEHERAGRWWWEEATQRECGLHVVKIP
jgi:phosphoadenosine phosphosulfate reductase